MSKKCPRRKCNYAYCISLLHPLLIISIYNHFKKHNTVFDLFTNKWIHFVLKPRFFSVNLYVTYIVESKYKVNILITAMSRQRPHHHFPITDLHTSGQKQPKLAYDNSFSGLSMFLLSFQYSDVYLHKIFQRTFICE